LKKMEKREKRVRKEESIPSSVLEMEGVGNPASCLFNAAPIKIGKMLLAKVKQGRCRSTI